ncbi:hypothetical protein B0H15DRAFT_926349 [Mycena belliarum]|uniref:Ketoreductase domain-containing protein n=1 Tax=Mycena belliarum TaxID=1033014 RepID=A0AAD6UIX8_9AGAR|nr:hypothetical protein B0H15DRAFT_926349 [Mycena belliae]
MKFNMLSLVKSQMFAPPPVLHADLTGKTVLVVGANTGIGFEAAKHFATMNPARLILACRSQSKGQAALENIKASTGCATAELRLVDLAEFASVRRFADTFNKDGGRLDLLIQNAAVAPFSYEATKDGWESSIQVNNLSTSLLTLLLLPRMLQTARDHDSLPRIVFVSSVVHALAKMDDALCADPAMTRTLGSAEFHKKNPGSRYATTKLLNILFVRALNARLASPKPLIVNAVNPGYCYSELRRNFSGLLAVVDAVQERLLAFTSEQGSRQLVYGAVAPPAGLYGAYIDLSAVAEESDFVLSEQGAQVENRVWDEMVQILSEVDPRVAETVKTHLSHL